MIPAARPLAPHLALIVGVALALPAPARAAVTYSDGMFHEGNWSLVEDVACPSAWVAASRLTGGGNPGAARHNGAARNGCVGAVRGYSFRLNAVVAPLDLGGVRTVDFAIDVLVSDGFDGPQVGPALRQGGRVFVCDRIALVLPSGWRRYRLDCLGPSDFVHPASGDHPDFGAAGGPIELGYVFTHPSVAVNFHRMDVDNWAVTVNGDACIVPARAATWGTLKLRYR